MQFSRLSTVCAFGLVVSFTGCGGPAKVAHPDASPAAGVVMYNGAPVADADVVLVSPESKRSGWTCAGKTGADGKFTISTVFAPGTDAPGVPPGDYTALVLKAEFVAPSGKMDAKSYEEMSKKKMEDAKAGQGAASAAPKALVPAKYAIDGTSTLKVKVEKAGNPNIE
jgi:hypothetical protein